LEELVSGLLRPKLFPFGKLSKAKPAAHKWTFCKMPKFNFKNRNKKLDHTNVCMLLLSTKFSYDTRWWQSSLETTGFTTETKGCRESTQHGVLTCLPGRKGVKWRWFVLCWAGRNACHLVLYHLPWQGAAQLRASGNPGCCCCCWYTIKCTQNTDITKITRGRQGSAVLVYSMTALWVSQREINWSFFALPELLSLLPVPSTPRKSSNLVWVAWQILRHWVSTENWNSSQYFLHVSLCTALN
jgi:hypothetical protein